MDKYSNHISCFFDPLPIDLIITANYPDSHIYKSNAIYEHVIDIRHLDDNVKFHIKETPMDNFLLRFWGVIDDKLYFRSKYMISSLLGNKGLDKSGLVKVVKKFKGTTRKAFEDLLNSYEFNSDENYRYMYAPRVAHAMIYPPSGYVTPIKIIKINLKPIKF